MSSRLLTDDKDLGKAIQDTLDTAITVDNNCNEITKKAQILALLQPKIEETREITLKEAGGKLKKLLKKEGVAANIMREIDPDNQVNRFVKALERGEMK